MFETKLTVTNFEFTACANLENNIRNHKRHPVIVKMTFLFNLQTTKRPEILKHKDKDYFICAIRKKPIQSKPEEILRQQIVFYLTEKLGYPSANIDIEVPMSYFIPRLRGRADIIIYDRPFRELNPSPFILVECKAPDEKKSLKDYRFFDQLNGYNNHLKAKIIALTNGFEFYITDTRTGKQLQRLPSFSELKNDNALKFIEPLHYSWNRTTYSMRFDKKMQNKFIAQNLISPVTPKEFIPYIIQLMDLFYDDKSFVEPQTLGNYQIIKDCGLRFANYGYAFSSGLKGNYRYFLLKQQDGNHRVVSYSLYHQNDWGTYLMIAVDDRQGHALELRLDKCIVPLHNDKYTIQHNGSMTVGKKGRLKNSVVLDYLKQKAPFLISNHKIILASFDIKDDLVFNQANVKDFIFRTATYAILREDLRIEI